MSILTSSQPRLVKSVVIDDRAARFGKTILEQHYGMPDGKIHSVVCVTTGGSVSVIVCPMSSKGALYLIRQFRYGIGDWVIEFPGGLQEPGHSLIDTAVAEIREEVGVVAESIQLIGDALPLNPALEDSAIVPMLALGCTTLPDQSLDETEFASVFEVTVPEFRRMVKSREIVDAKTIALGYLVLEHLNLI